ncbi:keratin, type I cytoskeletal 18-like [Hippocampus comes]|uniref:keratin, type I cytoskeletal 18-like n=1 Tax=Hippocampus comes TaxID=109280 RepID=UPI00094EA4E4|nr:PREDICTED: keratin, type I cytoskeletal 18-like [Hippocampus comes]
MLSNTAASMFGGAGGRGSRASLASFEGLRNVLRNHSDRDSAPPRAGAPATTSVVPADDGETLRGLNGRLSGYLDKVKQLEEENQRLKEEIDEILVKRKTAEGRDWQELEKPLNHLKNKIKDITMDNAKMLLQIDNAKLANADFINKFNDETKARKAIENDLDELKKNIEDTKRSNKQMQKEIDVVKDELTLFEQDHKNAVDDLREKIKNSEVNVEIETPNSSLPEIVNNIRKQYNKLATKNLKETEDWHQSKFENINVEEARNAEGLQSGKTELKDLLKQKQHLEIKVQGAHSTIYNLEESLKFTNVENGYRLGLLNQTILDLEQQLRKVRAHVESQLEMNKDLLCVKMRLEAEINNYQQLMSGNVDSLDFSFEDALPHKKQDDGNVSEEQETAREVLKQENEPAPMESLEVKAEGSTKPADGLVVKKNLKIKKNYSCSSSESEDEKAKNQGEKEKA